jgi:hypothetical protein
MSGIGGTKREAVSGDNFAKKVGLFEANIIAVNPTIEEFKTKLGRDLKEDSKAVEYLGESKDGNTTLRIDFWMQSITNEDDKFKVTFYLEDRERQNKDKIHYIGNAFPHNYADAWDDARGMMLLEWDKEPEYIDWPNCPKYRTIKLSRLIDEKDAIISDKMYLRVTLDIDITFEEANFIKETFMKEHDIRELSLITEKENLEGIIDEATDVKFESVDQIVAEQIVALETGTYNTNTLLTIYNGLHV